MRPASLLRLAVDGVPAHQRLRVQGVPAPAVSLPVESEPVPLTSGTPAPAFTPAATSVQPAPTPTTTAAPPGTSMRTPSVRPALDGGPDGDEYVHR